MSWNRLRIVCLVKCFFPARVVFLLLCGFSVLRIVYRQFSICYFIFKTNSNYKATTLFWEIGFLINSKRCLHISVKCKKINKIVQEKVLRSRKQKKRTKTMVLFSIRFWKFYISLFEICVQRDRQQSKGNANETLKVLVHKTCL